MNFLPFQTAVCWQKYIKNIHLLHKQSRNLISVFLLFFSCVLRLIQSTELSLGIAFEMQFDSSCQMFLHQCHHLLLVVRLISPLDDFRELTELPDFDCLEYNSSMMFQAECVAFRSLNLIFIRDRKSTEGKDHILRALQLCLVIRFHSARILYTST